MVSGNQKLQWEERNANGICAYCGKSPGTEGKGKWKWCKECHDKNRERNKAWYDNGGSEIAKAKSRMQKSNRRAAGVCAYCGGHSGGKRWCTTCKEKQMETRKRNNTDYTWKENTKRKAMEYYGSKCEKCGFDDVRVLHFHHINHDGGEDRLKLTNNGKWGGVTTKMHRDIIVNGYRVDLQLVCPNCHAIIHWEEGRAGYRPNNKGMTVAKHRFRHLVKD